MKKCPYCAEDIQDDAVKCRYCGEFLNQKPREKGKWYFKTSFLVIVFLCAGPLVLPLVVLNPRFNTTTKIMISLVVVVISYVLFQVTAQAMKNIMQYYNFVFQQ